MPVSGKPRRFLTFYGSSGVKIGGWGDYFRSFDRVIDAKRAIDRLRRDYPNEIEWWQVVDIHSGCVVDNETDGPKVDPSTIGLSER